MLIRRSRIGQDRISIRRECGTVSAADEGSRLSSKA
jgi:hypothetical protein